MQITTHIGDLKWVASPWGVSLDKGGEERGRSNIKIKEPFPPPRLQRNLSMLSSNYSCFQAVNLNLSQQKLSLPHTSSSLPYTFKITISIHEKDCLTQEQNEICGTRLELETSLVINTCKRRSCFRRLVCFLSVFLWCGPGSNEHTQHPDLTRILLCQKNQSWLQGLGSVAAQRLKKKMLKSVWGQVPTRQEATWHGTHCLDNLAINIDNNRS